MRTATQIQLIAMRKCIIRYSIFFQVKLGIQILCESLVLRMLAQLKQNKTKPHFIPDIAGGWPVTSFCLKA